MQLWMIFGAGFDRCDCELAADAQVRERDDARHDASKAAFRLAWPLRLGCSLRARSFGRPSLGPSSAGLGGAGLLALPRLIGMTANATRN